MEVKRFWRFFFPWVCASCRRAVTPADDPGYCGPCWLRLPRIQGLVCLYCGVPLSTGGGTCFQCRKDPPPLKVRAAGLYEGALRAGILRFKYGGRIGMREIFSVLLEQTWNHNAILRDCEAIVPVPLHYERYRMRGFNQSEELAGRLSQRIRIPVIHALKRRKATIPLSKLDRAARVNNLKDAFLCEPINPSQGRSLLLLDDISTTMATLVECSKALYAGGARQVKALVLARDLSPLDKMRRN